MSRPLLQNIFVRFNKVLFGKLPLLYSQLAALFTIVNNFLSEWS